MDTHDWLAERFEGHRTHLRAVAYRILGSASESWVSIGHVPPSQAVIPIDRRNLAGVTTTSRMAPHGSGGIGGFRPGALVPARMRYPAMIILDAVAEAVTWLSDRADPVPDEIRDEAARHYDERGLAALMLMIATTHVYNRLTVTIRQPVGAGG